VPERRKSLKRFNPKAILRKAAPQDAPGRPNRANKRQNQTPF
jgi:hypothetical protein